MKIKTSQSQKQLQKLSPAFIQSQKILQMGNIELSAHINEAVIENPVIDVEQSEADEKYEEISTIKWLSRYPYYRSIVGSDINSKKYMESFADETEITLQEHLLDQIRPGQFSKKFETVIKVMVYELDDNGHFGELPQAYASRYSFSEESVRKAIMFIQTLEPAGVGAGSVSEQLVLQLKRKGADELSVEIAEHHLNDMAQGLFNKISKETC